MVIGHMSWSRWWTGRWTGRQQLADGSAAGSVELVHLFSRLFRSARHFRSLFSFFVSAWMGEEEFESVADRTLDWEAAVDWDGSAAGLIESH
eukprot:scaffold238779_cov60-Attheya_sp.AAC.2